MAKKFNDIVEVSSNNADLTITAFWAYSADNKLIFFSSFPRKQVLTFHAKVSLLETTCMECQNLFFGKNEKNISKCYLLKFLPRVPSL